VQLRSNASFDLSTSSGVAKISIPRHAQLGGAGEDALASNSSADAGVTADSKQNGSPVSDTTIEGDAMDHLLKANQTKKFTGKPITLQVRDVDVQDVFGLIAETSGFNIILSDNVKGKLTLSLVEVPWDQALSIVLQTLHLGADRRGNVLRIDTLAALTQEKQLELSAKAAMEAVTPRITRVFPINYASIADLKTTILDLATAEAGQAGNQNGAPTQAPLIVETDNRTNSLIVRGLPEYVDRAGKIIKTLDTQTPQILIEGKVVEASEGFSRTIGGSVGGVETESGNGYGFSFNGGDPTSNLYGAGGSDNGIFTLASNSANGAAFGYTKLIGGNRINLTLKLAELESKVKIVSSPRTVVMNNKTASMVQTFPIAIQSTTTTSTSTTTTSSQISAALSLNVTPTVTSDGSVLMQLALQRDVATNTSGGPTVANRVINTNVLVESGTTLVLGGFYNNEVHDDESGVPFFRKIPIIGWLFGTKSKIETRSELMFFITPQVINPKKAGFGSGTTAAI
jgi:type IV pilus assembly protein PilQ